MENGNICIADRSDDEPPKPFSTVFIKTENLDQDDILGTENHIQEIEEYKANIKTETDVSYLTEFNTVVGHKIPDKRAFYDENNTQNSDSSSYNCPECDKVFDNPRILKVHRKIHIGERSYICNVCTDTFRNLTDLTNHQKGHKWDKPYQCSICHKNFSSLDVAAKHKAFHDKRIYKCSDCDKTFVTKNNLNFHALTHNSDCFFRCIHCDKRFKYKSSLGYHLRQHAKVKYSVKCEYCEKMFVRKDALKKHMRTHEQEKFVSCELCLKKFINNLDLQNHLKQYVTGCKDCAKHFKKMATFDEHIRKHLNDDYCDKYCKQCGKQFKKKSSFNKHLKLHEQTDESRDEFTMSGIEEKEYDVKIEEMSGSNCISDGEEVKVKEEITEEIEDQYKMECKIEETELSGEFKTDIYLKKDIKIEDQL